jgi:hypothetical protein
VNTDDVNTAAAGLKHPVKTAAAGSKDAVNTAAAAAVKNTPLSSTKAIVVAGDPKRLPRPPVAKAAVKAACPKRRRLKGGPTEKAGGKGNTFQPQGLVHLLAFGLFCCYFDAV